MYIGYFCILIKKKCFLVFKKNICLFISKVTETFTADVSEEIVIPQFLRDLSDQEVTEGDTVTFIVQLAGSPFPEISW